MARFAITLAAYAGLAAFVLIIVSSALTMGERIAYRHHCAISAAQLAEPVESCGLTR